MMDEGQIIEHDGRVVGVAIRVRGGFLFFSSDPDLRTLEATVFRRAELVERRVAEILEATQGSSEQCAIAPQTWTASAIDVFSSNVVRLRPKRSQNNANPKPPDAA